VAKAGLKFGDEGKFLSVVRKYRLINRFLLDLDAEEEKDEEKALTEKFKPLLDWLKVQVKDIVQDGMVLARGYGTTAYCYVSTVVISNRLVSSPCAVVADIHGYTANVERMIRMSLLLAVGRILTSVFMNSCIKQQ
jgi:heat shock protein 90kDa beta